MTEYHVSISIDSVEIATMVFPTLQDAENYIKNSESFSFYPDSNNQPKRIWYNIIEDVNTLPDDSEE